MLRPENSLLLIVDIQGKLAQLMSDRKSLYGNLQRMVQGAVALDMAVIWAEQLPDKLGPTIQEIAQYLPSHTPISKATFSCAGSAEIMAAIDATGRKQIVLVGIETHVCVYQTAADLLERGFGVEVVADAVGSRNVDNYTLGLQKMAAAGAGVTSTECILFELMGTAEHPAFRTIQQIVK